MASKKARMDFQALTKHSSLHHRVKDPEKLNIIDIKVVWKPAIKLKIDYAYGGSREVVNFRLVKDIFAFRHYIYENYRNLLDLKAVQDARDKVKPMVAEMKQTRPKKDIVDQEIGDFDFIEYLAFLVAFGTSDQSEEMLDILERFTLKERLQHLINQQKKLHEKASAMLEENTGIKISIVNDLDFEIFKSFGYATFNMNTPKCIQLEEGCACKGSKKCGKNCPCVRKSPAPYSQIICDKNCKCSSKCKNRYPHANPKLKLQFQKFPIKGWGIVTLERIKEDTFIVEYTGEIVNETEDAEEDCSIVRIGEYLFSVIQNNIIDGRHVGSIARFFNHSCSPNLSCRIVNDLRKFPQNQRLLIIADRDIAAGEELLLDYKSGETESNATDHFFENCQCGAENCRRVI